MLVQRKFIKTKTANFTMSPKNKYITLKDLSIQLSHVDTCKEDFFKRDCFVFENQIFVIATCVSFGDKIITLFEDEKQK